ncbi:helix-turn-helix domain-containing protein [Enterococcus larvae]|uniref:helix-turn-helix domain-containing protein n=1 Tax=Enterococcus larvae TaxID=2794352 RepID=UPI003F36067A
MSWETLILPANFTKDYLYRFILDSSSEIQILEIIFFNEGEYSIESLSTILHYSPSTVRRSIQKLNVHLASSSIKITQPKLRIEGNEFQIFHLFLHLFREHYPVTHRFYPKYENQLIECFARKLINSLDTTDHFDRFATIKSALVINIKRFHYPTEKSLFDCTKIPFDDVALLKSFNEQWHTQFLTNQFRKNPINFLKNIVDIKKLKQSLAMQQTITETEVSIRL